MIIIIFCLLAWTEGLFYSNILYPKNINSKLKNGDEFDFIIVGSGSAGSVVANRLSNIAEWKVLLLEAGGYPSSLTDVPVLFSEIEDTAEDWNYLMEPSENHSLGLKYQASRCPRGKVLGGSSNINVMLYVRGNKRDFDDWEATGNPGWNYASVIGHFKRNENVQSEKVPGNGDSGYLELSRYKNSEPVRQALEDGYKELGCKQFLQEGPLGYMDTLMTISNGTRSSTAKSFIRPIKCRKNLYLALYSQVSKLIIKSRSNKVVGVEVKINNEILKLYVRKEVILSAGSINSPQILMNSGIGPEKHLKDLGIEIIKNLSVGENLQDHLSYQLFVKLLKPPEVQRRSLYEELCDYLKTREGILGEVGITNFVTFVNTTSDSNYPNIQYMHIFYAQEDNITIFQISHIFGYSDEVINFELEQSKKSDFMGITAVLLKPKSTGKVLLRSANPFDKPLIIPNYLHSEQDMNVLIESIRLAERMVKTKALSNLDAKVLDLKIKNCQGITFGTDDYWRCYIRNLAINMYHQVGTCKMGPKHKPDSVVDTRLKVHGIQGIRVVDSSIMPSITSGNTNAPTIMIGEKGSKMIIEDFCRTV